MSTDKDVLDSAAGECDACLMRAPVHLLYDSLKERQPLPVGQSDISLRPDAIANVLVEAILNLGVFAEKEDAPFEGCGRGFSTQNFVGNWY